MLCQFGVGHAVLGHLHRSSTAVADHMAFRFGKHLKNLAEPAQLVFLLHNSVYQGPQAIVECYRALDDSKSRV